MANPGALLLLLAVAASQVDLSLMSSNATTDISGCPITYFGRTYSWLHVGNDSRSIPICFKGSQTSITQDCITIGDARFLASFNVVNETKNVTFGSSLHRSVPSLISPAECVVRVDFMTGSNRSIILLIYKVGHQAALMMYSSSAYSSQNFSAAVEVGGSTLFSQSKNRVEKLYQDISGCRYSGTVLVPDSTKLLPEICSTVKCNESAVLSTVSACGPQERCRNSRCTPATPFVCTVTGSTVIDFYSRVHSVLDRCVYSLIKTQGSSNFSLLAGFQERRRKDVTFLDHLILWLRGPDVKIYLEQGGRVRVDDQVLMLNTTAQQFHGVELSKDQTGVTAKIPSSVVTVFFDGTTAHVEGFVDIEGGLCGSTSNSSQTTNPSAEKSSSYSAAGCKIQHQDTVDKTIDCNRTTEHCNLMRQAPFTACHNHTDPEPHITACTNTLCKYPAVDGLSCQFLEAYAKSCHLKSNVTLEEWRSKAKCSAAPQASCQGQYCSAHEFCGEKRSSKTRCFCRAIFASKYTPTNALGDPTVCTQNSATLTLAGCLLEDKGIDYSALHLNDPNCTGHMDNRTHMVTFKFDSSDACGTNVTMNNSQIIYKNTIMMRNASTSSVITRRDQVKIDFSCFYRKPDIKTAAFRITDGSVVQKIVSGVWNYILMMNAYLDPGRTQLVTPSTMIVLNEKIWLELKTEGLDNNSVAIVTDSCWATSQPPPNSQLRYNLIIAGCPNPADKTVKIEGNGLGTSNYFSFDMFEFSGESSEIYLHCKLELCIKQGQTCVPNCGGGAGRRRRSARSQYADQNSAVITMTWNN